MTMLRSFRLRLSGFRGEERAAVPVEGVIGATFLIWWFAASFQFFDAYRQKNINLKASYTLADMLSRETGPISGDANAATVNQAYINGLNTMFDYMTFSQEPTWIRVSSVYWDEDASKYRVDWSRTSGTGHDAMTTPKLQSYKEHIPVLPTGDTVIIVETFMDYKPFLGYWLDENQFTTFIPTRPRFASCLPWESNGCGIQADGSWSNPDITDVPPEEGTPVDGT
ncbi:MAG TPA: hypothetical protein PK450_10740 [Paracoccaceae bacterium]|nr:hypothetical protein [Paracoccaceae bacterium]